METKKTNEVIFAFIGKPAIPGSVCTSTGYGYDAFLCTEYKEVIKLFDAVCIWSGPTKRYKKNGDVYLYYELSCRDKDFFTSDPFKRICKSYGLNITIIEDGRELYDSFYKDAKAY